MSKDSSLASARTAGALNEPKAAITDGMRWRYMIENDRNVIGFIHMLRLLIDGKGDKASFVKMTDRVMRSAQGAKATEVMGDDLLEALKAIVDECEQANGGKGPRLPMVIYIHGLAKIALAKADGTAPASDRSGTPDTLCKDGLPQNLGEGEV